MSDRPGILFVCIRSCNVLRVHCGREEVVSIVKGGDKSIVFGEGGVGGEGDHDCPINLIIEVLDLCDSVAL